MLRIGKGAPDSGLKPSIAYGRHPESDQLRAPNRTDRHGRQPLVIGSPYNGMLQTSSAIIVTVKS